MIEICVNNKYVLTAKSGHILPTLVENNLYVGFYFVHNGKRVNNVETVATGVLHVIPQVCGGKGGFGSMLRAIGAQIEKTTNREACRDLSGRRLRDINEEKRLKNWIDQQADRERDAVERKQKKLERLCRKPKHEFKDETYENERSGLPERLEDAVSQGLSASTSSSLKRKGDELKIKPKKKALWIGDDMSDLSSSEDSEDENCSSIGTNIKVKDVESCSGEYNADENQIGTNLKVKTVVSSSKGTNSNEATLEGNNKDENIKLKADETRLEETNENLATDSKPNVDSVIETASSSNS